MYSYKAIEFTWQHPCQLLWGYWVCVGRHKITAIQCSTACVEAPKQSVHKSLTALSSSNRSGQVYSEATSTIIRVSKCCIRRVYIWICVCVSDTCFLVTQKWFWYLCTLCNVAYIPLPHGFERASRGCMHLSLLSKSLKKRSESAKRCSRQSDPELP